MVQQGFGACVGRGQALTDLVTTGVHFIEMRLQIIQFLHKTRSAILKLSRREKRSEPYGIDLLERVQKLSGTRSQSSLDASP